MKFLKLLKLFFTKDKKAFINRTQLNNIIPYVKIKNKKIILNHPNLKTLDSKFALLTKKQVQDFLKLDWTNWRVYRGEKFDCDDFAIILWGKFHEKFGNCSVGFGCSDSHAFLFFVDVNRKFWIIEPQNDRVFVSNANKYKVKFAII